MGGRGSSSMSGGSSSGLPRGAAGMTVQFDSGHKMFYKANSKGVVLGSGSIDDSASPVKTNFTIRELYDRAVNNGYKVELHSKTEVKRGEQARNERRAENVRDIASAELHPGRGAAGISANRLLHRERKRR